MSVTEKEAIEMGEGIATLAAQLDAASHELLTRIRKFDEAGAYWIVNAKSCAHWLSWRIGLGPAAARDHVRVARALGKLPLIDAAMARGELSFSKVRAATRVATPQSEAQILVLAKQMTGAQLEKVCRGVSAVRKSDAVANAHRSVWARPAPHGLVRVAADLLPDEAAMVMKAIEQTRGRLGLAPGVEKALLANRADALLEIMRGCLEPEQPAGVPRPATPAEIIIEVGPDVLGDGWSARFEDGSHASAVALRRLACDAGVVIVATDAAGNALDVGRRTRVWPAALRRALWRRDRGCRFPGCGNRRWLDGHHLDPWIEGGETSLARGLLLCRSCHRLVHEGGWTVVAQSGEVVFRSPSGREYVSVPPPLPLERDPVQGVADEYPGVGAGSNACGWDGETPDYADCIDGILRLDGAAE